MHDATRAIEQREDEYLRGVALQHTPPEKKPSPSPGLALVGALLQQISLAALAVMAAALVAIGCAIRWLADEHAKRELMYAGAGCIAVVGIVNAIGYGALAWRSRVGERCFALLLLLLSAASMFALDQLAALQVTLESLRMDMTKAVGVLSDADVGVLVNGGAAPSLLHCFTFDGPAHFLRWLHAHCSFAATADLGTRNPVAGGESGGRKGDFTVDSPEFYESFWRPREHECVSATLTTFRAVKSGVQITLVVLLVVMVIQLMLSGILFLLENTESGAADRIVASRSRRKRRKGRAIASASKAQKRSRHTPFASVLTLLAFAIAVSGILICALSASVFLTCDIATTSVRWVLIAIFASGVVSVVSGLLVSCCRLERTAFVKWLLVLLAVADVYAVSHCMTVQEQLWGNGSETNDKREMILRGVYALVSKQTCSVVSAWRAHTCEHHPTVRDVRTNGTIAADSESNNGALSNVCREELALLLLATLKTGVSWLGVHEVMVGLLLLVLFAPGIRDAASTAKRYLCGRLRYIFTQEQESDSSLSDRGSSSTVLLKRKTLRLLDARDRYLATVRLRDEAALKVEAAQFDAEWAAMTGHSTSDINEATVMLQSEFNAIVRVLVIRRLTTRCKMDVSLSVSKDGTQLFVKIVASDNLLMTTLCDMDYTLEIADFVDPGPAFWKQDKREIKNDMKILDLHTAKNKLRLLAMNNVIPKREAERFPNESLARVSARIHALTRAARVASGSLKCQNPHLPYAHYVPNPEFQFLFKKHPNRLEIPGILRRSCVLRTIDCIRITKHLIEREFSVNQMVQSGLLTSFHCLHSASRFDFNSRAALLSSWILYWRPRHFAGEFDPETHWLLNQLGRFYPFRQPLRNVRDYFGECIAFYFAWLAFYTQSLLLPAFVVVAVVLCNSEDPDLAAPMDFFYSGKVESTTFTISPIFLAYGVGVIVWGLLFAKLWERKSVWYQLDWGMTNLESDLHDRPGFWGETRRNPVTNELETHFSSRKRFVRQIYSVTVLILFATGNLLLVTTLILLQGYVAQWGLSLRFTVLASSICLALVIQWNGDLISLVAHRLSEFENYQHNANFQASVISKVFALQLMNTFSGLFLLAFVDVTRVESIPGFRSMTRVYQQRIAPEVSVLVQLETLLLMIFLVRITSHLLSIAHNIPLGMLTFDSGSQEQSNGGAKPGYNGATTATSNGMASSTNDDVEEEDALEEYRGSYEDYTQIVVQFGLVVMFSSVFPPAPLLAFVECALEMRLDALDLCLFYRRPSPDAANGIGAWAACVQILLKLSFATLFGLVYFTADNYEDMPTVQRVSAFLAATLGCWLLVEIVWVALPSTSSRAEEAQARNAFLIERYFGPEGQSMFGDDSPDGGAGGLSSTKHDRSASALLDAIQNNEEDLPPDSSLEHYRERAELLHRLNVALRKRDDTALTGSANEELLAKDTPHGTGLSVADTTEAIDPLVTDVDATVVDHGDTEERDIEEMIVGYFKPVRDVNESFRGGRSAQDEQRSELPQQPAEFSHTIDSEATGVAVAEGIEEAVSLGIPIAHDVHERSGSTSTLVSETLTESGGRRPSKRSSIFARIPRQSSPRSSSRLEASEEASTATADSNPKGERRSFLSRMLRTASAGRLSASTTGADAQGLLGAAAAETGEGATHQPSRLELSGIEAVREATRHYEFDFSDEDDV